MSDKKIISIIQNLKYDRDLLENQKKGLVIGISKRAQINTQLKEINRKIAFYQSKLINRKAIRPSNIGDTNMHNLQVFLCYASEDEKFARALYEKLRGMNITPWFDKEDLLPGQVWELQINQAIRKSDAVIICLSQNSVNKRGFVQKEFKHILEIAKEIPENQIFIIPVKLEECDLPLSLEHLQTVNLFEKGGIQKLTQSLEICLKN